MNAHTRLDALLIAWRDGTLSPEDAEELKALLRDPVSRRQLVEHFHTSAAVAESFSEERADRQEDETAAVLQALEAQPTAAPMPAARPSSRRKLRKNAGGRVNGASPPHGLPRRARKAKDSVRIHWPWVAAAACVVLVAGAHYLNVRTASQFQQNVMARLRVASDGVDVFRRGERLPAHPGMDIVTGDEIDVPTDAEAILLYADDSTFVRLLAGTRGKVWQEEGAKRIRLDRGEVRCEAAPQERGAMELIAPFASAEVLGTRFTFSAQPRRTRLAVEQGRVRFTRASDGRSVIVHGGEFATAGPGTGPLLAQALPGRAAQKEDEAAAEADPAEEAPDTLRPSEPQTPALAVVDFTLVDADTGRPIPGFDPIPEGATIDFAALPTQRINIRANTRPNEVGSVSFRMMRAGEVVSVPGSSEQMENYEPYMLCGDSKKHHGPGPTEYDAWEPRPAPGSYRLEARPHAKAKGGGEAGPTTSVRFRVEGTQ